MGDVILEQLASDDKEQFILDNQEAFNYGAIVSYIIIKKSVEL